MWVCGFFSSVGNGLRAVPIRPGQKTGNGPPAGPDKMSRDTRPRVSATLGSAARTPREGCPDDLNVYAPFAGIRKSFWCILRNGQCPFPTLHYLGIAQLGGIQIIGCNLSRTRL